MTTKEIKSIVTLTGEAEKFLLLCADIRYWTLEVKIKDGQPVMSKVIEQWHKHDG